MTAFVRGGVVRAVVYDCDGVLLESVACKGAAFRRLFAGDAEHVGAIEAFHFANGGLSRYAKFDHIYANILRRPLDSSRRDQLARTFSQLVLEEVVACPMVDGAADMLEVLHGQLPLFVASATPESELREILTRRGLARYFEKIYGYPVTKADAIHEAGRAAGCPIDEVLFVGDAKADYEASVATGCCFVGRQPPDGTMPFIGTDVPMVPDCRTLIEWICP